MSHWLLQVPIHDGEKLYREAEILVLEAWYMYVEHLRAQMLRRPRSVWLLLHRTCLLNLQVRGQGKGVLRRDKMLGIFSSYNKPTRVLKRCMFLESAGHVVVAYIQHIKAWSSSLSFFQSLLSSLLSSQSKMSKMFLCWSCKYVHPHQSILSLSPFFLLQHESTWLNQSGAVSWTATRAG